MTEALVPARTALVIVDMQNDFLHPDGAHGRAGLDIGAGLALLPALNDFVAQCRRVGVLPIYLQEVLTRHTSMANLVAQWGRWDTLVVEGTWGAQLHDDLVPREPDEPLVVKSNYDGFQDTVLDLVLKAHGISTLLFAGVGTNVCVETTARHAYGLGYRVVTLEDLCAASSVPEHEAAIWNLGTYFGEVRRSAEIVADWALTPQVTHL
ncbi:MAG: cysteine hydrolase [Nocardioidaceae bacterium]|nr:cysteine hydrolase [Nocardioidaceae bacterium]